MVCCFNKSTIWLCMEYCFHDWVDAPTCYLNIWDKLQKWEFRTVNHLLETLSHCLNIDTLSLFCRYCFGRRLSELVELVPLPCLSGWSTRYSNRFHDFLSLFLDVIRVSMSAVSFRAQLDCGILYLQNAFSWHLVEMVLKGQCPGFQTFFASENWRCKIWSH